MEYCNTIFNSMNTKHSSVTLQGSLNKESWWVLSDIDLYDKTYKYLRIVSDIDGVILGIFETNS